MNFLLLFWKPIAIAVVVGGLSISLWVQNTRLASCKREFEVFKAEVKAAGEIAQEKAKQKEIADKRLKQRIDSDHATTIANLRAESKRLRDTYTNGGNMPQLPSPPGSPDETKVSRADINGAIRSHVETVREILGGTGKLVEEGAEAVIGLDAGKDYVKEQMR